MCHQVMLDRNCVKRPITVMFYHHCHNRRIYLRTSCIISDNGVQIINIDDPYNPTNVSSITDGTRYPTLNGSISITTATIGGSTYALVAAWNDNGVQIINID